ncbi:MAG: succinate dehydrogenase, partial [Planctomycetaceae bacterium]|nr:succinate dehydrogenase [Planctomycetaceae bacterium]
MSWLTAALKSSVGKKCIMGGTGLFLCFFLVIHLAGNLLLYVGAESYNAYAHSLHANPALIIVAEVILYGMFAAHIYLAITTNR